MLFLIASKANTRIMKINYILLVILVISQCLILNYNLYYYRRLDVHPYTKFIKERKVESMSNVVKSPMAGAVINMRVKPGDSVTAGQPIAIVEAMKMQVLHNVLKI
mgnify:CR=1 FL=1